MSALPQISVIVPVYRAEKYLHDCIDSILAQSFSDFEILLVDDGSPDRSGEICEEYARKDPRIHVIHQTNQGQAAARNHALPLTRGEWLCYVDSDDEIHPQMLEHLYSAATANDAGISMCRMWEAPVKPENFAQPVKPTAEVFSMDEKTLTMLYDEERYPGWEACAKLIRREYAEGYPFCPGRVYEDNEAVSHWLIPAKRIALMQDRLYYYRTNPESTTKSQFNLKKLDYLWALESIIGYYRSQGYGEMAGRFFSRYADAAAASCACLRKELNRPDLVWGTFRSVSRIQRQQKLKLTKKEWLFLLEMAYPDQMERFWAVMQKLRKILK